MYEKGEIHGWVGDRGWEDTAYHYSVAGILDSDLEWDFTGEGVYREDGHDAFGFGGTGTHTSSGADASGSWSKSSTAAEYERRSEGRRIDLILTLDDDDWTADTNSTILHAGSTRSHSRLDVSSDYRTIVDGGSLFGDREESSGESDSFHYEITSSPNASGEWNITTSAATADNSQRSRESHRVIGAHVNGNVAESIAQSAFDDFDLHLHSEFTLASNGEWVQQDTSVDSGSFGTSQSNSWTSDYRSTVATTTDNPSPVAVMGTGSASRNVTIQRETTSSYEDARTATELSFAAGEWFVSLGKGWVRAGSVEQSATDTTGAYTRDAAGERVAGDNTSHVGEELGVTVNLALSYDDTDADGRLDTWKTIAAESSGESKLSSETSSSYSGAGTYRRQDWIGDEYYTITGTVSESGLHSEATALGWTMELDDEGEWTPELAIGLCRSTGDGFDQIEYTGAGDAGGFDVTDRAFDRSEYDFTLDFALDAEGQWTATGNLTTRAFGNTLYHQTGDDVEYHRTVNGGLVTGFIMRDVLSRTNYEFTAEYEFDNAAGDWAVVTGSGFTTAFAGAGESYVGSGSYVQSGRSGEEDHWTLFGSITESGSWHDGSSLETHYVLTEAGWDETLRLEAASGGGDNSFDDSGVGNYRAGELTGVFSHSRGETNVYEYRFDQPDDDPEAPLLETGSGGGTTWDNWDYDASGVVSAGDVSAVLREFGLQTSGSTFTYAYVTGPDGQPRVTSRTYTEYDHGHVGATLETPDEGTYTQKQAWDYTYTDVFPQMQAIASRPAALRAFGVEVSSSGPQMTLTITDIESSRLNLFVDSGNYGQTTLADIGLVSDFSGTYFVCGYDFAETKNITRFTLNLDSWSVSRTDSVGKTKSQFAYLDYVGGGDYLYGDMTGSFNERGRSKTFSKDEREYKKGYAPVLTDGVIEWREQWLVKGDGHTEAERYRDYDFSGTGFYATEYLGSGLEPSGLYIGDQNEEGDGYTYYRFSADWNLGVGEVWVLTGGSGCDSESRGYNWDATSSLPYGWGRHVYSATPMEFVGSATLVETNDWAYSFGGEWEVRNHRWNLKTDDGWSMTENSRDIDYSGSASSIINDPGGWEDPTDGPVFSYTDASIFGFSHEYDFIWFDWSKDASGTIWNSDASRRNETFQQYDASANSEAYYRDFLDGPISLDWFNGFNNEFVWAEWTTSSHAGSDGTQSTSTSGQYDAYGAAFGQWWFYRNDNFDDPYRVDIDNDNYYGTGSLVDGNWTFTTHRWGYHFHFGTSGPYDGPPYDNVVEGSTGFDPFPSPDTKERNSCSLTTLIHHGGGSINAIAAEPRTLVYQPIGDSTTVPHGGWQGARSAPGMPANDMIVVLRPPSWANGGSAPALGATPGEIQGTPSGPMTPLFPDDGFIPSSGGPDDPTVNPLPGGFAPDPVFGLAPDMDDMLPPGYSAIVIGDGNALRDAAGSKFNRAGENAGPASAAARTAAANSTTKSSDSVEYDDSGNVTKYTRRDAQGKQYVQQWEYDSSGNVTKYTDQEGRVTKQQVDPASGNVLSVTRVVGEDDETTSDPNDPADLTTAYGYTDGAGGLPAGLLASITDPEGNTTLVGYETDPTKASYGKAVTLTQVMGVRDDDPDRLAIDPLDPDDVTIGFGYDASGKVNSLTDAAANQTTWVLDADPESASFGRVLEETITIDDGNPLTDDAYTRYYAYDAAGRLTRYTDRMDRTTEYEYFASGDAEGRIQFEKWYAVGDDPDDDPAPTPVRVIEYGYAYADGHLVGFTVDDSDVDFVYSYDAAGYLTSVAWNFAGLTDDVVFAYGYEDGDLTSVQAAIGETDDFQNEYARDSFGRLTRVTQTDVAGGNPVADKRADFTYTDAGQLKTIIRSMDIVAQEPSAIVTTTFTYDPSLGWLAGLVHEINNTNEDVVEYAYTHQADGQIDTLVLDRDVDDVQSSETYDFDYDQQGQLTQVDYTGTGAGVDESYQYGANGNRTGATVGSASRVYTPGAYNRLESVDDGTTVRVFGYDPEGNLVLKFLDDGDGVFGANDTNIVEYAWDHRNRLVSVTNYDTFGGDSTQQVGYGYDYLNRMISRTVDADGAGTTHSPATEYFVYDHDASNNWALKDSSTSEEGTIPFGANPATDAGQIVLQLDESGVPTHRYLWGPAVDMLLADETVDDGGAEDVAWTLTDHQNSIRDIVVLDDNGTPDNPTDDEWKVGNHVTYDAWGNTVAETDAAISGLFGWTGRLRDKLTGLHNNGNRWYDAVLAHWQSEDPIGFAAGDANLYRYCGNDPVNWIDPSGLANLWNPLTWGCKNPSQSWWGFVNPVSEENRITVGGLPGAYFETALSGKQASSLAGYSDSVTDSLNPFGGGTSYGPAYGHNEAYEYGQQVGTATGLVMNTVMMVGGLRGVVTGIQAVRAVGGGILQVGQLALANGGTVNVVMINGQAVVLTAELAAQLGLSIEAVAVGFANLNQAMMSAGNAGSGGPSSVAQQMAGHHPWPKYLQGPAKQALEELPANLHNKFHGGLDKLLPRQYGSEYYRQLSPAQQAADFEKLRKYTEAFDRTHGTRLWEAIKETAAALP
ncbi:MAG TPA: hypothetical protein DD670_14360 [Planctomycetaceae bacterium]|nr:hypothetical protein [Planctomycetaceae bacterium]